MKNLCFLLFLIIGIQTMSSQKHKSVDEDYAYKATYELIFQMNAADRESHSSESMLLYFGDKVSRFSSAGKFITDSIIASARSKNKSWEDLKRIQAQAPVSEFGYYIYKGIPEGKMSFIQNIMNDDYMYSENKNKFSWKILSQTDSIAGFLTQKATTQFAGRDYVAWFAPEIPFSDGPYKFNGLPGLIVKIADTENHYVFELVELEKLSGSIQYFFEDTNYIKTSKKKLLQLETNYKKNPLGMLERRGISIQISDDTRRKLDQQNVEEQKKKNNPLEREL